MSVEENSDKKASPSKEMAPQEDGTKVPLTDEADGVHVQEAKYVANPNGDAKIDIGGAPAFSGLTKEELMKYAEDPFWIRMRWFLFILFWLGWLVMLVLAIVIIIRAPGCEPPPELLWVEENPMIEVNSLELPSGSELLKKADSLGISSVYFPNLINDDDFNLLGYNAELLIKSLGKTEKQMVTDLPSIILPTNPYFTNATMDGIILEDGSYNYSHPNLPVALMDIVMFPWIEKGVKGFLLAESDTPEKVQFTEKMNELLEPEGAALGSNVEDLQSMGRFSVNGIRDFMESESGNWTFYRFKGSHEATGSDIDEDSLRLLTIGLFLFRGTPIISDFFNIKNSSSELIQELTKMRVLDGLKFGEAELVNTTDATSLAFTRVYKGTPAYAVALNFKNENATMSFKGMPHVAESGTIELQSTAEETKTNIQEKVALEDVRLGPYEGLAIQFVANFD